MTAAMTRFAIALTLTVGTVVPAYAVTIDWVTVGNAGNAADTLVMNKGPAADFTAGYGSVGYTFQMSKYDVTNSQYTQFLNAADPSGSNATNLYDGRMSTDNNGLAYTGGINFSGGAPSGSKYSVKAGQENFPATWIRWASSARFVNWLANGQGAGSTESGVYDMSLLTSSFATPPTRAHGATFFLPSEDEYYKAAYYDPTKNSTGDYWQYGTRSDTAPASLPPPGTANAANIGSGTSGGGGTSSTLATTGAAFNSGVNYLTAVGAYTTAESAYGLYDVEGLIYNWTEGIRESFGNQLPIARGGSWQYNTDRSGAAHRGVYSGAGAGSYAWYGFRVAAVPEPSTVVMALAGLACGGYSVFRRRRAR